MLKYSWNHWSKWDFVTWERSTQGQARNKWPVKGWLRTKSMRETGVVEAAWKKKSDHISQLRKKYAWRKESRIYSVSTEKFHMRGRKQAVMGINKWELRELSQQMKIPTEKFGQKGMRRIRWYLEGLQEKADFVKREEVWVCVDGEKGRAWPHTRGEEVVTHRARSGAGEWMPSRAQRLDWTWTEERRGEWIRIYMHLSKVVGSWGRSPKMISNFPIKWEAKLWSEGDGGQCCWRKLSSVERMPRIREGADNRKDW